MGILKSLFEKREEIANHGHLSDIVRSSSLEVFPFEKSLDKLGLIPDGKQVEIATHDLEKLLRFISMFSILYKEKKLKVVPHLPARLIQSGSHLQDVLETFSEHNIKDLLVIAGDEKEPQGPYPDSLTLLQVMETLGYLNQFHIGIGCYPRGHPKLSHRVLQEYLIKKVPYAEFSITQIDFDPETMAGYLAKARDDGVNLDFYLGTLGKVRAKKLFPLLRDISTEQTLRYLRSNPRILAKMISGEYDPTAFVLAAASHITPQNGILGISFSTFNCIDEHIAWEKAFLEKYGNDAS